MQRETNIRRQPFRIPWLLGFCSFLAITVFFLWEEHKAHILGAIPYLLLLLCPVLITWALLVYFIAGRPGIPPLDDVTVLDGKRRGIGWFAFGLLALILLPLPHALSSTFGLHCPYL